MDTKLRKWANAFRRAAQADHHEALRAHLRRFDFPDRPELLLEGTIQVVAACCAYAELDGSAVDEFLKMQGYDSASMEQGSYVFTLDIFDKAFGRVVTSHAVESLDLADLYGHPWHDHGVVGYLALAVGRAGQDE